MDAAEACEVLGVPRSANAKEVRDAFLRLSRRVHSDTGGSDWLFREVKLAYETLTAPGVSHGSNQKREGSREAPPGANRSRGENDARTAATSPFHRWIESNPSYALLLSGLAALTLGPKVGEGAPLVVVGLLALFLGATGLLGAKSARHRYGIRSGGALLLVQLKLGAPRMLRAIAIAALSLAALVAALTITWSRFGSSRRT